MSRGTVLELRGAALRHNAQHAVRQAPGAEVCAMIKADGYGHGLLQVAAQLSDLVQGLGVALAQEAEALLSARVALPVMVMEGFFDLEELQVLPSTQVEWVVHADWQLALLARHRAPVRVWIKLDGGMHRLGFFPHQVDPVLARLRELPWVTVLGLVSHFACADQQTDPLGATQLHWVQTLARRHGLRYSAANSAGLYRYPEAHGVRVRPGISLYGASPLQGHSACSLGLQVTQRLSARLISIRDIDAGETVGYGAAWTAPRPSRIGVVAIGYGDGYPRHAPAGTPVAVRGQRTGLAGRVSMDMLTIDLTDCVAEVGDEVELWGDLVAVDDVATACGTISYELFCQVTPRVPRRWT